MKSSETMKRLPGRIGRSVRWVPGLALCVLGSVAMPAVVAAAQEPADASSESTSRLTRPIVGGGADQAEVDAYRDALRIFELEIHDYRQTVSAIVEAEYRSRRARIDGFFQTEIDARRIEERQRREAAIVDFERFLRRYPNHARHTPDVLFRLAELHYEKTEDDYLLSDLEYEVLERRYELGVIPELPDAPEKDFTRSIVLFQRLVTEFPDYRFVDGAWYLLAMCQLQMFQGQEALASLQHLVENFPDSEFAQEAWLRIGEHYFERVAFAQARPAYERALGYGESVWYDKILFKLGWSNYLLNDYDTALANFTELLEFYERMGEGTNRAVREEALQYFAIAIAEEDWDLDGQIDPEFILGRLARYLRDERPYTQEVLDRIAQLLMENRRYEYAIDTYRHILARYPVDRLNARRHDEIITAHLRMGDVEAALAEGAVFAERYASGTDWHAEQERQGAFEEIAFAERVARDLLITTAGRMYNEADELARRAALTSDVELAREARARYQTAARVYQEFLTTYPNDLEAYDVRMFMAQSLFYAENYVGAAEAFRAVRDSQLSDEYREIAGELTIIALGRALEREINAGRLEARAWPPYRGPMLQDEDDERDDGRGARGATVDPVPDLSLQWVRAIDEYIAMDLNSEEDPTTQGRYAYGAARLFFDYRSHDETTRRAIHILERYCGQDETGLAAALLLESFRAREQFDQVEFWANEIEQREACITLPDDLMASLRRGIESFRMGAVAQQAEALYEQGLYEEAAQEYARLTNEYADSDFAPLGLYNAGVIYEQDLRRYETAMRQFERLVREYPNSAQVNDALVRIAINSRQFFDFDRAIETYLTLHQRGVANEETGQNPILDAAELLQYTQQYGRAADAYMTFVSENPRNARAAAALYTAAILRGRAGDDREMLRLFERFRRDYGNTTNEYIDITTAVMDTLVRELNHYRAQGDTRNIARAEDRLLAEHGRRNPTNPDVLYAVAEIIYNRSMQTFAQWDARDLGDTQAIQTRRLTERRDGIAGVLSALDRVMDYGSADWIVCAFYQRGRVFQRMADLIYTTPPPDFSVIRDPWEREEAEDIYMMQITDLARAYEEQAVREWVDVAYPGMQRFGIVNECTRETTRQLNRYQGDEYPIFREELQHEERRLSGPGAYAVPPARIQQGGAAIESRPGGSAEEGAQDELEDEVEP